MSRSPEAPAPQLHPGGQPPPAPPTGFNAVWLSDVHLGSRGCRAEFLLDFLANVRCDRLYLLGDIVDLWALRRSFYWPRAHQQVLREIIAKAQAGTPVIYVPGNHDGLARELADHHLLDVEVRAEAVHQTADGRRLLLLHGDQFDSVVLCSRLHRWLGNAGYCLLLWLNQLANALRRWVHLPYWSLAYYIKNRVGNARAAIETFERAAVHEARRRGFDGVICGHIHQPELRMIDGLLYCNDGDWVESCTALVEHRDGRLELIHWGDLRQRLKCERTASNENRFQRLQLPRLSARRAHRGMALR
ncbi:MAG: UDP-2,3-diacylglucosamine diphosphatase [Pseudomonadota bacterium]